MEIIIRWLVGGFVALVVGGFITKILLSTIRKRIKFKQLDYAIIPSWFIGLIERTFFTVAVAFQMPGVLVGMIAWIAAKMAANWGKQEYLENIESMRISALIGGMTSLFFAMIGGLICNGTIWF